MMVQGADHTAVRRFIGEQANGRAGESSPLRMTRSPSFNA